MPSRMTSNTWTFPLKPFLLVFGLTAISVAISLQGWRSRLLHLDFWIAAKSADTFIETGKIPDHGCLSSKLLYIPPGTNLLIIPGVFFFRDQRLYELPGAAILTSGTLVGLFLLCCLYFGEQCAWVSAIIYSVSALGLQFADSLWPRGHPFFAVWFFYFLGQWAVRRRQSAFALALLTWSTGMYYFLELAPLLIAFPIAFMAKRPRVSLTPVLGVLVLSSLLWIPFLRFESYRGYRDFIGLMSPTVTAPFTVASRHPILNALSGRPASEASSEGTGTALGVFAHTAANLADVAMSRGVGGFIGGFDSVMPVAGGALFAIFVLGLCLAMPQIGSGRMRGYRRAALLLLLGAASLGCFAAGLLMHVFLHHAIQPEAASHLSSLGQTFAMNGGGRRLWWAWPIQVAFIVWFLSSVGGPARTFLTVVTFATLTCNKLMFDHTVDWVRNGWGGKDPEVVQLLDAAYSLEQPTHTVSIGYLTAFSSGLPSAWTIDSEYKVGTQFDRYLRERYKVNNLSTGLDGIGDNDKYRIIQTDFKGVDPSSLLLGDVDLGGYEEIARVPGYRLMRAKSASGNTIAKSH
jgi:hypothetical protein